MEPWYPRCPPVFGLTVPTRVGSTAGPTPDAARGPRWRRTSQGLHVPVVVARTVEQRIIEAAARLPSGGMVTGWAALRLAGAAYFDGSGEDVAVLLPHSSRIRAPGVLVTRTRRPLPKPARLYGVPCAPAEHALLQELGRQSDDRECVVMVEMALVARVVDHDRLRDLVAVTPRVHARVAQAVVGATGHYRSPKEVHMALVWERDAGHPRALANRAVLGRDGSRLAVVDLLDPESGTYGEYDGEAHRSRSRHRRDVDRAEKLRDAGLESFTVVAGDPVDVQVARMRAARRRAAWLSESQRAWRVGDHVPMRQLMRSLTSEEMSLLELEQRPPDDDWGT